MTPAERIAELRVRYMGWFGGNVLHNEHPARSRLEKTLEATIPKLLALAEAVPVLLATVSEGDRRWMSGPMVEAVDRLAAAWAALGDG